MQRLKRNWKAKTVLKRIGIVFALCAFLGFALFSVLPLIQIKAACTPTYSASYQTSSTSASSLSITYTAGSDDFAVANYQFQGSLSGTLNVTDTAGSVFTDLSNGIQSFGFIAHAGSNTITVTAGGWASTTNFVLDVVILTCMDGYTLSNAVLYQNAGSGTTAPTQTAYLTSQNPLVIVGFGNEELETVSATFTFSSSNVFPHTNTKQYSAAGSNGITEQVGYNMAFQANQQAFQLTSTNSGKLLYLGFLAFQAGGGCGVYACDTTTYTISWTNSTCVNPTGCTQTTTSTTINYDATSTIVTIIQCDGSPNCATFTQSANKTVIITHSSVKLITKSTTTTLTHTALNAPTTNDVFFWLIPMLFLLIPAFTFMATAYEFMNNAAGGVLLILFLLGLNIGAVSGIFVKIMPYPILIFTFIPLCIVLYAMRGSL